MPEIVRAMVMDTCVLSNFALSNSLFILQSCYSKQIYITSFVLTEILGGLRKGYKELSGIKKAVSDGWLIEPHLNNDKERKLFEILTISLGAGESAGIT